MDAERMDSKRGRGGSFQKGGGGDHFKKGVRGARGSFQKGVRGINSKKVWGDQFKGSERGWG